MKKDKYINVKKLNVSIYGNEIGILQDTGAGIFFTYSPEWINKGIELSPLNWPLRALEYPPTNDTELQLPGFIADSLPDSFGKDIMMKYFSEKGMRNPNYLDLLSIVGTRGMGALDYIPANEDSNKEQFEVISKIQLWRIGKEAQNIVDKLNNKMIDPILLSDGSSIGGARPKVRIAIDTNNKIYPSTASWIAQKNARQFILKFDTKNVGWGRVEYAYSQIAKAIGINMPETKLISAKSPEHKTLWNFAIERFDLDVQNHLRLHYHSAAGFYNRSIAPERINGDYKELLNALDYLNAPSADKEELFKRCVFNIYAHNVDDHFKNFGFCMDKFGKWRLSPAFDLCYTDPAQDWVISMGRCTKLLGIARNITRKDILEFAAHANIKKTKATNIIELTRKELGKWQDYAEESKVPSNLIKKIGTHLKEIDDNLI